MPRLFLSWWELIVVVGSQLFHYFTLFALHDFDSRDTPFAGGTVRLNYVANFNILGHTAEYNTCHISVVSSIMSLLSSFLIIQGKLFGEVIIKLKSEIVADLFVTRAFVVQVAQLSLTKEVEWPSKHFCVISLRKHALPFVCKPSVVSRQFIHKLAVDKA